VEGVSQIEIHCGLASVCGQKVFSRKEASVLYTVFKDDRTALNDDPETRRLRT
jgi:hypothetical protein